MKIRYSIHFLAQQKGPLNEQNSLTSYYSTYIRFLEGFIVTTTTTQGVRFHQYIIKWPVKQKCSQDVEKKKTSETKHLLSQVHFKNAFVAGAAFNIELNSRKINVPEHQ